MNLRTKGGVAHGRLRTKSRGCRRAVGTGGRETVEPLRSIARGKTMFTAPETHRQSQKRLRSAGRRRHHRLVLSIRRIHEKPAVRRVFGAQKQELSRLAGPGFTPLGGPSVYAAWRAQVLRRLAGPGFTPLGGPRFYAAWRGQCLRRLAGPVFAPLGGPSVYAAWRAQCLRRLVDPVFAPLGYTSFFGKTA